MSKQEGVIKFDLSYTPGPSLPYEEIEELNDWRTLLVREQLIGQDPDRYGGYGFGNLSHRLPPFDAAPQRRRFAISGTQTGGLAELTAEHYAIVEECNPAENRLVATGPIRPSSESLTHSAVYAVDASIRVVLHVHSPAMWAHAAALGMPITDPTVDYGTPEMAREVAQIFDTTDVAEQRIFAMGGHEDGIIALGRTVNEAGETLLTAYREATRRAQQRDAARPDEESDRPPENSDPA